LNTRDEEVVMEIPRVSWRKYTPDSHNGDTGTSYVRPVAPVEPKIGQGQEDKVVTNLRLDHLNSEEKRVTENTCRDYRDIFHLKGNRLSCTNAVKHSINVIPGTSPTNTRPYRLPEAQKSEIDDQIAKLM
jgi:hypothetical protein